MAPFIIQQKNIKWGSVVLQLIITIFYTSIFIFIVVL